MSATAPFTTSAYSTPTPKRRHPTAQSPRLPAGWAARRDGPWRPMRASGARGVRTQANRSRARTPGAEPGPGVGQNSCHSRTSRPSDSARTSPPSSFIQRGCPFSFVSLLLFPAPPFLFRGHNSLRETLSNKRFNMPAL